MKTTDVRLAVQPHYLLMLKLYVQPDGSLVIRMGNATMSVSHDEVHALLLGTLDFASVCKRIHDQLDVTALAILSEDTNRESINGYNG
ncbi:MAG TPA: hypothetical protein VIX20_05470 [Ktedonobacteraceae bacterium]